MNKIRSSDDNLIELKNQPHFKRPPDAEPPSTDPMTPTPMIVDVERINCYDRNPRSADNPEFENIKNNIKASKGMDWVLNITRRPKAKFYMLAAGGNTTLRAIKELLGETGDPCFQQIHCLFIPWTSDNDVLLAHLKENDQRSDLILIDRARAIRDLRGLIEAETGTSLSQREFVTALKNRGYGVSRRIIRWLDYAVDVLNQVLPRALKAGMGSPQVERLLNLERAFNAVWEILELDEAEITGLFTGVLSRHDCEYVDPDLVRKDLADELAVSADCSLQRAQVLLGMAFKDNLGADEIRARLANTPEWVPFPDEEKKPSHRSDDARPPIAKDSTDTGEVSCMDPPASAPALTSGRDVGANEPKPPAQPKPISRSLDTDSHPSIVGLTGKEAGLPPPATQDATLPDDIHALRRQAFDLARDIAVYMGAEDIVVPIDTGYGFLVGPMPNGGRDFTNAYSATHKNSAWMVTDALWWMLATISEQFSVFGSAIPHIPPEWSNRPLGEAMRQGKRFPVWQMENHNQETLMDVPFTPVPQLGTHGINILDDEPWNIWLDLVSTTRQICKLAEPWE